MSVDLIKEFMYMKNKINKKMKVLILTQPLGSNYGGIIQAYALQAKLTELGLEVDTNIDFKKRFIIKRILGNLKRFVLRRILKVRYPLVFSDDMKNIYTKNTGRFIKENIKTVNLFNGKNKPDNEIVKNYDAFVVGSDQVWRKSFSDIGMHLLDFTNKLNVLRVSYAASFGLDDLFEYSTKLVKGSAKLARRFDAISVREDSGVDICKKYWDVTARQLIDPTLLLNKSDYIELIERDADNTILSNGKLFAYILDKSNDKKSILTNVSSKLGLKIFEILPDKPISKKDFYEKTENYMLPPVTQWLRGFFDANFVVTDSFHGCVFSIIFNKPFIAIGNSARGLTRFVSLLKKFNLDNRLILSTADLSDDLIFSEIDWNMVNGIIKKEQKQSFGFIQGNLCRIKK